MGYRQLGAVVAALCIAGPALADWTYRAPQGTGDVGAAQVSAEGRTLSVGCGRDGVVTFTIAPGAEQLGAEATEVMIGMAVDGNGSTRVNVPFVCSATSCYRGEVPRAREAAEAATRLVDNLRRGSTLQIYFRDRQLGTYTLRGSAAALSRLEGAAPNCIGL